MDAHHLNSSLKTHASTSKPRAKQRSCPQSTRGCPATFPTEEDLERHCSTCPFVALLPYFDLQDQRATLLETRISGLAGQVNSLEEQLEQHAADCASNSNSLQAGIEALDVRQQLSTLDESMQRGQEFATLRAGLEGVRRQLFGLLMERESRLGMNGMFGRMHPPPPGAFAGQQAEGPASPAVSRADSGTKL